MGSIVKNWPSDCRSGADIRTLIERAADLLSFGGALVVTHLDMSAGLILSFRLGIKIPRRRAFNGIADSGESVYVLHSTAGLFAWSRSGGRSRRIVFGPTRHVSVGPNGPTAGSTSRSRIECSCTSPGTIGSIRWAGRVPP